MILHVVMKKCHMRIKFTSISKISAILMLALLTNCNNPPKGDDAAITDEQKVSEGSGETFMVDTADSEIRFEGYGVGKKHPGRFRVSSGSATVSNGKVTGGSFVINMKSLKLDEEGDMFQNKLKPHLMSGDFFDVEKFSESKFEITSVEPYERTDKDTSVVDGANFRVSGNFTLKGETKNITFPAKIDLDGNTLKAKADFDIDRTQWKMNYGNDKTLGDKFISERVNVEFDIKGTK